MLNEELRLSWPLEELPTGRGDLMSVHEGFREVLTGFNLGSGSAGTEAWNVTAHQLVNDPMG
jgi:hypothetical protein